MGRVIDWLGEHRVDAVITTGYNSPGLLRLIAHCRRASVPNFLFGDSNVFSDRARGAKRLFKKALVGWVLRRVTGLMTCGSYGKRFFDAYGGASKPCFYMPHEGSYRTIFNVGEAQRQAVADKFRLVDGKRRILYCGRLAAVKRVDTLIDAFARIAGEYADWNLLIVGGGPLESELKARVPVGLQSRVEWTGFINDPDELAALYACGDVFVLPSSFEPWAVVVSEAAAAGMAIVASEVVGAAGELCREGVNGRLFPPGDVGKLADALKEIAGDDDLLRRFRIGSLQVLDDWRRRGDPVQGVRLALAYAGLLLAPPAVEPDPPTPATPLGLQLCNGAS
jgi:glycosyltransferase involved in cell wall biosynthesis